MLTPLQHALDELGRYPPSLALQPERAAAFRRLGDYLEQHIRPGQPFDLRAVQPNAVWQTLEERLDDSLARIPLTPPPAGHWRLHQWYSSGVILDSGDALLGFDVIPLLRTYGWPDRFGLTERLATMLDALLITHRHPDHYDEALVQACLNVNTPVYMPAPLAAPWPDHVCLHRIAPDQTWILCDAIRVTAREGIHIWRDDAAAVPLCVYELTWPDGNALIYGGDVDYTRPMTASPDARVRAFFVPWRAPNAAYEAGTPDARPLTEAVQRAIDQLQPDTLIYEHCAELEHVYDGFPCSFDLALDLKQQLTTPSELLFWGESLDLAVDADQS
jgi:hypothetical protein